MKKTILTLCVLLAFALIFTGCGGNDAGGNPAGGSGSLDGDWVASMKMAENVSLDDFEGDQALYDAFLTSPLASEQMALMKFTISGNAYSAYPPSAGYAGNVMNAIKNNLPFPEPSWNTTSVDSGTITVSGDTITFTSSVKGGGTGTLASDRKSFTLKSMEFVKQ